jgi:hypothetical protein
VPAQLLARLDAPPCHTWRDGAGATLAPAPAMVVGLVRVELARALARPAPPMAHAWDGVQRRGQHHAVVAIGRAQAHPEGRAPAVDHKVALRARFAAIRRVRAGLGTPRLAATAALSSEARLQSRCPASASRSRRTRCSAAQAPASCQSRSRRQQVMPEQPISLGSISQGMSERSTKTIPARTVRSLQRGRPPQGRDGSGGSSGAKAAHRSSETRGLFIAPQRSRPSFVRCSKSVPARRQLSPGKYVHAAMACSALCRRK